MKLKAITLIITIMLSILTLTGCGDLVEIQDRDFVLALGISYHNGLYQATYSLPKLGESPQSSSAGDQSSLLRTYEGSTLHDIETSYNANSESRLDYRHLQVIILDDSICSAPMAMKNLLVQINDNYDISHNVLVYYFQSDIKSLMELDSVNGSIGEHLKKLNNNNSVNGLDPAKIGALIDGMENQRTLFIPALFNRDESIAIEGGIFFQENHMVRLVSPIESNYYQLSLGKSNDQLIRLSQGSLVQLKEVTVKSEYELTDEKPLITLKITGSAKILPGTDPEAEPFVPQKANQEIQNIVELQLIEYMKVENIDYLNLYEKSSYKNRAMWIRYEDKLNEFIRDSQISVTVDIGYES